MSAILSCVCCHFGWLAFDHAEFAVMLFNLRLNQQQLRSNKTQLLSVSTQEVLGGNMIVNPISGRASQIEVDALVVVACDKAKLVGVAAEVDEASGGMLSRLVAEGEVSTKIGKTTLLYKVPGVAAKCILVAGGGENGNDDPANSGRIAGAAARRLAERERARVAFSFGSTDTQALANAIAASINGFHGQDLFRSEKNVKPAREILCFDDNPEALQQGSAVGHGMLLARELVNLPPNYLYPESFARRAAEVAVSNGLELEIWDELRLRREKCDSLLAVAAGSTRAARMLVMRYAGRRQSPPLAIVGKGVTFDSGGLSIKPTDGMVTMKCDMAGAATVLATMQTIASLEVETPVVGLVGLVENMLGGNAYKLGDVLTSRSGKTIEVLNTDAEGRLVLADVLNVACQEKPSGIIDLATLTGACVVALGTDIAGAMSNNEALQGRVLEAAKAAGEMVWPLPMFPHFREQIQSQVADIKNVGDGRWGGAITAAKFLEEFVGQTPWVHLDIAGPAFNDKPKPHQDAGATGCLVNTLTQLLRRS